MLRVTPAAPDGYPEIEELCDRGLCLVDYVDCLTTKRNGVGYETRTTSDSGYTIIRNTITTPVGSVSESCRGNWKIEHYVKEPSDYSVVQYAIELESYTRNYEAYERKVLVMGERGLVYVDDGLRSPFQQIIVDFAGVERRIGDFVLEREEVISLYHTLYRKRLERFELLRDVPGVFLKISENISAELIGPETFRRYHMPFYADVRWIIPRDKKLIALHLDGRLQYIRDEIEGDNNSDIVESMSIPPEGDSNPLEVMTRWIGKKLWFAIPACALQLPIVLSPEEVLRLCDTAANMKQKAIILTISPCSSI